MRGDEPAAGAVAALPAAALRGNTKGGGGRRRQVPGRPEVCPAAAPLRAPRRARWSPPAATAESPPRRVSPTHLHGGVSACGARGTRARPRHLSARRSALPSLRPAPARGPRPRPQARARRRAPSLPEEAAGLRRTPAVPGAEGRARVSPAARAAAYLGGGGGRRGAGSGRPDSEFSSKAPSRSSKAALMLSRYELGRCLSVSPSLTRPRVLIQ
ncbi:sterile alpha motif domain-containing protein 1-like [Equus caballus]|uniref:sterile alpha motif domain-containing protein 1-like n=1 Tax=Equus caballus TaxID=9796 RepID=UPI0038B3160C